VQQGVSGITDIRQGRRIINKRDEAVKAGNSKLRDTEEGVE